MPLTIKEIDALTPTDRAKKYTDAEGLYLLVHPNGSKYWRYDYRYASKRKTLALGVYPKVSLKDARQLRQLAQTSLKQGIDPARRRKVDKIVGEAQEGSTFRHLAEEWFEVHMKEKALTHQERALYLLDNVYPDLGALPIDSITPPIILASLRRIEQRGARESAHRAKQTIGQVFRYAIATGRAERDLTADLRGALKPPVKGHFAALTDPARLGAFMLSLENFVGTPPVRTALHITPYLFVRPGELRHMEWDEIQLDRALWIIPSQKAKTRKDHYVPLATQVIDWLNHIQRMTGEDRYVFPSYRGKHRPLSENTIRVAMRDLGWSNDEVTPHGFRATARTVLDETLGYRVDWIEHQLAHAVKDTNGRAYNRTSFLKERAAMMQHWADYLDGLREAARQRNKQ